MTEPRRVRIRLKNPLPEGAEINTVLPDSLEEIEEALARSAQAEAEVAPPTGEHVDPTDGEA